MRYRTGAMAIAILLATGVAPVAAEALVFEAEHANLIEPPMELMEHPEASGGICLRVREGAGRGTASAFSYGMALYHLRIPRGGSYRLWVRVYFPDECSASFWGSPATACSSSARDVSPESGCVTI